MQSTERTSVQEVSPGTYRVNGVKGRSVLTGRFVTSAVASRKSKTTANQPRSTTKQSSATK